MSKNLKPLKWLGGKSNENKNGEIISHYARRKAAPENAIFKIEKLYKKLLAIEKNQSTEIAEKYFYGLLEEKRQTYNNFILEVLNISQSSLQNYFPNTSITKVKPKKKGFLKKLFS